MNIAATSVQVRPSAPPAISQWLGSLGQGEVPILTVAAPPEHRQTIYGWCRAIEIPKWQSNGIRAELVWNMLHFGEPFIADFLRSETFTIDEPLRSMVDQKWYLISDLFRVLLEARFQVAEGAKPEPLIEAIASWIQDQKLTPNQERLFDAAKVTRRVLPTEQLDLVYFLVTLASQNGILTQLTVSLDRMDQAARAGVQARRSYLKDLDDVAFGAVRWEKLGSPLGIILGVNTLPFLDESSKLGRLLKSGSVYSV